MSGFAVIDLETTGLSRASDRIVEVAVVQFSDTGVEEGVFVSLVHPGMAMSSAATRVNGITNSMLTTAPPFEELSGQLHSVLADRVVVGYNVATFDIPFLQAAFREAGVEWAPTAVLDALPLARRAYPGLDGHSLASLCLVTNISNSSAHRAEGDARATWQLLCTIAADDTDDLTGLDRYELPVFESTAPPGVVARRPVVVRADPALNQTCAGQVVVFTGDVPAGYASRAAARDAVLRRGGRVTTSISGKTTLLVCGPNSGSKVSRAQMAGVKIVPVEQFDAYLRGEVFEPPKVVEPSSSEAPAPVKTRVPPVATAHATPVAEVQTMVAVSPSAVPPAETVGPPQAVSEETVQHVEDGRLAAGPPAASCASQNVLSVPPVSSSPPGAVPQSAVAPVRIHSRTVAALLAFFLGFLGIHRFYLDYAKSGLVMLAVAVLTLGLAAPVLFVIALVDFVRILTTDLQPAPPGQYK